MDKVERKRLIKSLLSGRLSKKQRKAFADLESVNIEIKKQWNESGNRAADMAIKEQIWKKVKTKCEYRKNNRVLVEPRWYFQYTKAFNKERKVWLSGNSLFEVYKHEGSTFQVYIDKAFIEVKGTCFHIKQTDAEKNEITLFRGKIEFNVESTGQKTVMKPLQRVIYNPRNAEMRVEQITNIKWENGKYNFTDIPLQELISIINQMYNSDVTLAKGINHESAFTGSIRYDEPLEDVVNKICFTLNLNKEEHANKIIIKK